VFEDCNKENVVFRISFASFVITDFNNFFKTLGTYDPEGDEKLRKWIYKLGYDHQSVRSVDGKLSCRRTAL